MKLQAQNKEAINKITVYFSTFIRIALNALLVVLCAALAVGVVKTGYDLVTSLNDPLDELIQTILINAVFIIAIVEIALTILGYFKDGRVHVRYIVDTILIIMLKEIVVVWFTKPHFTEMASLSLIIVVLVATRVTVTRLDTNNTSS